MNISRKNILFIIEAIIILLLFYLAFTYENAKDFRASLLLLLFSIYFVVVFINHKINNNQKLTIFLFSLEIGLVLLLEMNSKYAINYFIHSLYVIIILKSALTLNRKSSLLVSLGAMIISIIKYIYLISINRSLTNIAGMVFFILINLLIIIIAAFAKYYREEKDNTVKLYNELLNAHKKLQNFSDKIKELTLIEERNRIARDLHDTLGHNITGLIMQLEMAGSLMDDDIESSRKLIEESKNTARNNLKQVRKIVEALKEEDKVSGSMESIRSLINNFSQKTGIEINYMVEGTLTKLSPDSHITLYRIVQEAMTNAVRHGKANKMDVRIMFENKKVVFKIEDNGTGCQNVIEGYGLKGMKDRVSLLGGEIRYESKTGFQIMGWLPLNEKR